MKFYNLLSRSQRTGPRNQRYTGSHTPPTLTVTTDLVEGREAKVGDGGSGGVKREMEKMQGRKER